jgi:hypothetical protein
MFNGLIKAFLEIEPTHEETDQTIFEICGFPHYENVVSNVLAFFFDDNNNHNLKGLLTKSLIEASEISESNLDLQFEAEREVRTETGKYIDILLNNDSCCIVIENKIWAPLYNDLNDYIEHAKKSGKNQIFGIVLSMWELDPGHPDFVNVTYSNFISKIRDNLGHFIVRNTNQHLFLLVDLMNNLEKLYERGLSMNFDFINFVRQNHENVIRFGKELKTFHDDLRKTVKQVNAIVIELIQDPSIEQWPWRNLPDLYDVAVTDFTIENGVGIAIDSKVDPTEWEFQVFIRKNPGIKLSLADFCISKGLKGGIKESRFILSETLPLETDPTDVAKKIIDIINCLKT